jgi:alkyl sulfatase BDS1-like metallo-beta-lactamase superfamily hydrolase
MMFYFPKYRALCLAEDAVHTMHNLYSLRGAQVRDGLAWSKFLNETIELFGAKTDVAFASHNWPTWGNGPVVSFLKQQRDLYKFIHDQSLRLLNQGYTPIEIGEQLHLPPGLANEFYNRGYYGTLNHNAKAVYQRYLGWFDGNPANLHPLPPEEAGKKYVELLGGPKAILAQARKSFDAGEYRWVVELVNHLVFTDPDNGAARRLQADALEQLGYQAESGPWRNFYLNGAQELRQGTPDVAGTGTASADMLSAMSTEEFFDFMAAHVNGVKATGQTITLNWNFTDTDEQYAMTLENSVLIYTQGTQAAGVDVTLTLKRSALNNMLAGTESLLAAIEQGDIQIQGNPLKLIQLVVLLDSYPPFFNIVTP